MTIVKKYFSFLVRSFRENHKNYNQLRCDESEKYIPTETPNEKDLGYVIVRILRFQEDMSGMENTNKLIGTKIPTHLFLNFEDNGSVCHILSVAYEYHKERGWTGFRFPFKTSMAQNVNLQEYVNLFYKIKDKLIQIGCLKNPTVYVHATVSDFIKNQIQKIIPSREGSITEKESDATHIIYPPTRFHDYEYARFLMKIGNRTVIHYYGYPHSYDTCTVVDLPFDVPDQIGTDVFCSPLPHRVCANWVIDSHLFNEWVPEIDYEVGEEGERILCENTVSFLQLMHLLPNSIIRNLYMKTNPETACEKHDMESNSNSGAINKKNLEAIPNSNDGIDDSQTGEEKHQNKAMEYQAESYFNQQPSREFLMVQNRILQSKFLNAIKILEKLQYLNPDGTVRLIQPVPVVEQTAKKQPSARTIATKNRKLRKKAAALLQKQNDEEPGPSKPKKQKVNPDEEEAEDV